MSELKNLILHTPVVIEVEDEQLKETKKLQQFSVDCSENDKFLLLYVMIKLKLINGKTIVFVNDISRCFRLKLFLERMSIRSAVLNSQLPQASRYHIVDEGTPPELLILIFPVNKGAINLVIATDERKQAQKKKNTTETKSHKKGVKAVEKNVESYESESDDSDSDEDVKFADPGAEFSDEESEDSESESVEEKGKEQKNKGKKAESDSEDNEDDEDLRIAAALAGSDEEEPDFDMDGGDSEEDSEGSEAEKTERKSEDPQQTKQQQKHESTQIFP